MSVSGAKNTIMELVKLILLRCPRLDISNMFCQSKIRPNLDKTMLENYSEEYRNYIKTTSSFF